MKKPIPRLLAFVAISLASVACQGNSQQAQQDSLKAPSPIDSSAKVDAADSLARATRTATEIQLITAFYSSELVAWAISLEDKEKLRPYCTDRLLDELEALYKENPDILEGDLTEAYATYAFTGGDPSEADDSEPDWRPIQLRVMSSGAHRYLVSYQHLGRKCQTELQMTSEDLEVKIDRILKRAW